MQELNSVIEYFWFRVANQNIQYIKNNLGIIFKGKNVVKREQAFNCTLQDLPEEMFERFDIVTIFFRKHLMLWLINFLY